MVCNNTSIDPAARVRPRQQGATLVEFMVALGIGSLVLVAVMALVLFSARSFAALTNYVDLDVYSRNALDTITREIRQADKLVSGSATAMTFQFTNPTNAAATWQVTYAYNPTYKTLTRLQGTRREVMLKECSTLVFTYFQRNPIGGSDLLVPTSPSGVVPKECKAVQLHWICSRSIMGKAVNTESVQSARVVIRKV